MKKLIATLLALCMVLSFLPATALAVEPIGSDPDLGIDQEASELPAQAAAAEIASGENTLTDQVIELEEHPRIAQAVELEHCHPTEPTLFSGSDEAQPYLKIGLRQAPTPDFNGKITLTDYSTYYLYATYVDKNHNETDVTTSMYCQWGSIFFANNKGHAGSARFNYEYKGTDSNPILTAVKLETYEAGELFSFTASYSTTEGTVYSEPCVVEVAKLNNGKTDFILQCAALSAVVYTQFPTITSANDRFTIGSRLENGGELKDRTDFISTVAKSGATFASFYSAAISNWEVYDTRRLGDGFYGTLFRNPEGGYVLAFRGTEPTSNWAQDIWHADLQLGLGYGTSQLSNALQYYDDLLNSHYFSPSSVTLTGHSLGGGLANYVSVLRNVRAITFNAPSTMVSAINGDGVEFAGNFTGLNDGLRTDYVNYFDWVGNTGVGDNENSTKYSNLTFGNWSKGGNIDRTIFLADQSAQNGLGMGGMIAPHHFFNQILAYNKQKNTLRIPGTLTETNPTKFSFNLRGDSYILGSTGNDDLKYSRSDAWVFGGDGADTIYPEYPENVVGLVNRICGGSGDDKITGSWKSEEYVYYLGHNHGHDTINDSGGEDLISILGCDSNDTVTINYRTNDIGMAVCADISVGDITVTVSTIGSGTYIIHTDNGYTETISRRGICSTMILACPVDMLVYDTSGTLACELKDGIEMEKHLDFGCFSVKEQDGEYVKTAMLYEDGYTVRLVGIGDGEMKFSNIITDENGTVVRSVEKIPVTAGTTYTAVNDVNNDTVLLGDSNFPDVVFHAPTSVQVNADTTTLRYGESITLHASVYPETAVQDVWWSSSDPSVAVVDQDGNVTVVGAGSAEITAVSSFDDTLTAACPITVSDETFSMDSVEIGGIEPTYVCTGCPVAPDISASLGAYRLIEGIDYSVNYENNVDAGTATVTLTGNGYFEGTRAVTFTIRAPSVSERVNQLVEECLASGAETDYDKAIWFHDWLIYHADYDHTYQNASYRPEGVLINGRGVCQSYADAYSLLLTAVGIENIVVTSYPMNHAWNIVKIDGIYTHIDCTWDDPNSGGLENHTYFGLGDREMEMDHTWAASLYPECQKLRVIVEEEALPAPYDLFDPVAGVDFTFIDSSGRILTRESIEEASNGNVLLVFGRPTCSNTRAFLDKLSDVSDILEKHGTQVIAVMESMEQAEEIAPLYPFTCAYEADSGYEGWQFNQRIGLTSGYTYPQVVLQNSRGNAFYYSTGYVYEPLKMVSTAIQDLPLTDRISYSPTYLYSNEEEMYACLQTALANRETDIKLCNPAYASVSSDDRSASVDYVIKNAASYGGSFNGYYPSFGTIFIVCVEYASEASLPDPDPFLDAPLSGIDLSFADASGTVHSSSEYGNVLLVYGRATCSNTQALLRDLHMWKDVLDRNDVTVIAVLESQNDVEALSDLTPFQCMADTDGRRGMWNVLDQWGTLTSVTYPAVFFQADTGEILYVSTGYVYEPDKLVATVIQGQSNDNHNTYRISFDANGGTLDQPDKTVVFGEMYGPLPIPTKTGYTFDGWFTTASGGIEVTSDSLVSLTEDQTLYAHWRVVESEIVPVVSIALNKTEAALTVGDTATLIAAVTPENATNKAVTWTSSDPNIAAVKDGVVTAKAAGSALITVATEDGGFKKECVVIVVDAAPNRIRLIESDLTPVGNGTVGKFTSQVVCPDSAENKSVTVIIAFYNNNGRMLTTWLSTCVLHNGDKIELTGQIPTAENNMPYTLSKVFILESEKLFPLFSTTL